MDSTRAMLDEVAVVAVVMFLKSVCVGSICIKGSKEPVDAPLLLTDAVRDDHQGRAHYRGAAPWRLVALSCNRRCTRRALERAVDELGSP